MTTLAPSWLPWLGALAADGCWEAVVALDEGTIGSRVDRAEIVGTAHLVLGRPQAALDRLSGHVDLSDPQDTDLGTVVRAGARAALGADDRRAWLLTVGATVSTGDGHPALLRVIAAMLTARREWDHADPAWQAAYRAGQGTDLWAQDHALVAFVAARLRESDDDVTGAVLGTRATLIDRLASIDDGGQVFAAGVARMVGLLRERGDDVGAAMLAGGMRRYLPPAEHRLDSVAMRGATAAERRVMRDLLRTEVPLVESPRPALVAVGCRCTESGGFRYRTAYQYATEHLRHDASASAAVVAVPGAAVARCPLLGVPWLVGPLGYAGTWLAIRGEESEPERPGMYL